jgi:hypothetical protein
MQKKSLELPIFQNSTISEEKTFCITKQNVGLLVLL